MLTKTEALGQYPVASHENQHLNAAMRACAAWAAIEEHDKILDMNCGDGALLSHLNQRYRLTVCGMCDTPERARCVREQLQDADVIAARMEDIPWRDDTFDAVLLSGGLRGDVRRVLDEALRVLRQGGQFVMASSLLSLRGEGEFSRREIMRMMQEAGFQEVSFRVGGFTGAIIGWKEGKNRKEQAG